MKGWLARELDGLQPEEAAGLLILAGGLLVALAALAAGGRWVYQRRASSTQG